MLQAFDRAGVYSYFVATMAKSNTLINQLAKSLYARILKRKLQPGDVLGTERQLATDFGVAYGTMREAVGRLHGQGILEGRPRHGLIVQRPDPFKQFGQILPLLAGDDQDIIQLRDFRVSIELGALHLAIGRVTAADLKEIEATLDPFEKLQKQKRSAEADVYDIRFHQLLLNASGNNYLMSLHEVITRYFKQVHKEYPGTAASADWARTREHRVVFEAMQAGDRHKAADALWHHLVDFELKRESNG